MLLSEAIEALLLSTLADGRSDRTLKFYRDELAHLLAFLGDVPVESVTIDNLRQYVADLMEQQTLYAGHPTRPTQKGKLSIATIQARIRAFKRLFSFLEQEGRIETNPARRIKTPRLKHTEPKGVSQDDVLRLLASMGSDSAADLRDRAIILFLYDTGCRVGGLCGLRLDDLDLDGGLALVTEKRDKTRYAMFIPATAEVLRLWLEVRPKDKGPWVFVGLSSKSKGALTPNGVSQMLARRSKQAGCTGPTNAHAFRHGFAKAYLMAGGDLGSLSDIMGHSDVGVTKAYYAIFTLAELREKHGKLSPIVQIFGGNENGQADS